MKSARKTVEKEIDESEHGDVTPACDDDQETEAHKDCAQNVDKKYRNKTEMEIILNTREGGDDSVNNVNKVQMEKTEAHQQSAQELVENIREKIK